VVALSKPEITHGYVNLFLATTSTPIQFRSFQMILTVATAKGFTKINTVAI
jgi:hypothetical protein